MLTISVISAPCGETKGCASMDPFGITKNSHALPLGMPDTATPMTVQAGERNRA